MRTSFTLLPGVLVLFLTDSAVSAPVIIDTSYDLKKGFTSSQPLDGGPVMIASGDRVELTVRFKHNQALTIADGDESFMGWLRAGVNESNFTIQNATVVFLGFTGDADASPYYSLGSVSGGSAHIGPALIDFLDAGQTASFTGYRVTYEVESLSKSPLEYAELWFSVDGSELEIGPAAVSPVATAPAGRD